MYNINILSECSDENIRVAIITAIFAMLNGGESSMTVSRMKRGSMNSPVWNSISRQENLNNKF